LEENPILRKNKKIKKLASYQQGADFAAFACGLVMATRH